MCLISEVFHLYPVVSNLKVMFLRNTPRVLFNSAVPFVPNFEVLF